MIPTGFCRRLLHERGVRARTASMGRFRAGARGRGFGTATRECRVTLIAHDYSGLRVETWEWFVYELRIDMHERFNSSSNETSKRSLDERCATSSRLLHRASQKFATCSPERL